MSVQPKLDAATYAIERAICDKAQAHWEKHATYSRSGASSLSAELAKHPDHAACTNEMRGRVEQYELLTEKPSRFGAYVGEPVPNSSNYYVTTWTGDILGTCYLGDGWRVNSYVGSRMFQASAWIGGKVYTGRTFGSGMFIGLRETAASARKIAA